MGQNELKRIYNNFFLFVFSCCFGAGMAYRRKRHYLTEGLLVLMIVNACIEIGLANVNPTTRTATTTTTKATTLSTPSPLQGFTSITKGHPSKLSSTVATKALSHKTKQATTSKYGMLESVVIPSSNSEREAQEIYDKALKQFDAYGVSTRIICATWEKRGCQCSGTVDELSLSCRGIGLNEIPTDLPKNLIKL